MKKIGVDLSIQSSCICENGTKFHLIISDQLYSKKTTEFLRTNPFKYFKFYIYEYTNQKGKKEFNKSCNTYHISNIMENILNKIKFQQVNMEAIALSAIGTLDQLSGINYITRFLLFKKGLPFGDLNLISPSTLKRVSVGKGDADKKVMEEAFKNILKFSNKKLLKELEILENHIKIDDIADSYFLYAYESII